MLNKKRKKNLELIILPILITLISILLSLNIIITLFAKSRLKKRKNFEVNDIIIKYLKPFKFLEDFSKPFYGTDDLGSAGELYLLCYSGLCYEEKKEDDCHEYDNCDYLEKNINYQCSLQCFNSRGDICDNCPYRNYYESDDDKIGKCSKKEDDIYEQGKICIADNIIYFWKGKKYVVDNLEYEQYSYLKDAKLKDEECPPNTKNCGILDDEENKLCISINSECPFNVISCSKLNQNNYLTSEIDNETTIYYAYDENAINSKIIAGLYVDTDIYINKEEESNNPVILDTYNLSEFLKDNKNLYKGVDFGYDPYKINNLDKKSKSYLKVGYNRNPNLKSLKEKHKWSLSNKNWNNNVANLVEDSPNLFATGIPFYGYSLVFFIFCFICGIDNKCKSLIGILSFVFSSFFILLLVSIIGAFQNITIFNKAKEYDPEENYNNLRILNIIYIILSLFLLIFIILSIILILYYFCNKKRKDIKDIFPKSSNIYTNSNPIINDSKSIQT